MVATMDGIFVLPTVQRWARSRFVVGAAAYE
jgi:hypothetical protein